MRELVQICVYLSRLQRSEISSISIASWQTHGIDAIFVRGFLSYVFFTLGFFHIFSALAFIRAYRDSVQVVPSKNNPQLISGTIDQTG